VEQHDHDDVGRDREEVACKPQLIQGLVRDDIRRCRRGVTTDEDPAAREAGEPRYHDIQQIEEPSILAVKRGDTPAIDPMVTPFA